MTSFCWFERKRLVNQIRTFLITVQMHLKEVTIELESVFSCLCSGHAHNISSVADVCQQSWTEVLTHETLQKVDYRKWLTQLLTHGSQSLSFSVLQYSKTMDFTEDFFKKKFCILSSNVLNNFYAPLIMSIYVQTTQIPAPDGFGALPLCKIQLRKQFKKIWHSTDHNNFKCL